MKIVFLVLMIAMLSACAGSNQAAQPTAWTMSWGCYTNYCCTHVSPNSCGGNGSFSSDTLCLEWETGFLNTAGANNNGWVSSCTAN